MTGSVGGFRCAPIVWLSHVQGECREMLKSIGEFPAKDNGGITLRWRREKATHDSVRWEGSPQLPASDYFPRGEIPLKVGN
jgi:hypothetical protein